MLTDTHCHLDFARFDEDRAQVLARAAEHGVEWVLNPGIDLPASRRAIALAEQHETVYAAVGVHPNEAQAFDSTTVEALRSLAQHLKVVAIGEIGLDYYRERTPRAVQARAFRTQLDLAAELQLPVIVHCREAHADACEIIAEWQAAGAAHAAVWGVFHSFGGDASWTQAVLDLGFYIGITGPVTYPKADELRSIAVSVPIERLLIETDAPFLAPQQRRGKRNEPAYVRWVAERIAVERGMTTAELAQATTQNAQRLFQWKSLC